MKGIMIFQSRPVRHPMRRHLSLSLSADASLLADASADRVLPSLLLNPADRLDLLFGDPLDEELFPQAAKRPAKQEDDDEEEDDEDADDADEDEEDDEEAVDDDEEEDEEDEDEDEEDEDEEDEFDDPDSGFDDDEEEEEDFDDDE